jgi:hypothetical protein
MITIIANDNTIVTQTIVITIKTFCPILASKEEFQISETVQLNANKKSILTKETNLPNGFNNNTLTNAERKEVSFSLDDHRDSGIFTF